MVKTKNMKPKFKIGEFVKLKGIVEENFYEIENVYQFKDSIHYGLTSHTYPYPETGFESLTRNEKLEIIIKDNCEMIDLLIASVAQIIKKMKKGKDRYWEGFDDGKESSLNHNIVLIQSQLKSHKELIK